MPTQVQADVRTIISRDFATRHSLRFPRVERVRYDKSPFDVQTDGQLWELVEQNKGVLVGMLHSLNKHAPAQHMSFRHLQHDHIQNDFYILHQGVIVFCDRSTLCSKRSCYATEICNQGACSPDNHGLDRMLEVVTLYLLAQRFRGSAGAEEDGPAPQPRYKGKKKTEKVNLTSCDCLCHCLGCTISCTTSALMR